MNKKGSNHTVAFAARYSSPVGYWLSARTALTRLEALLDDAKSMDEHFASLMPLETRWAPWFGAEIISYYCVGYVTCLEWHARSRLVDLLSFKPSAIKADDIKQVRDTAFVESISANVTVAGLVGAATNVSTFESYMSIFERIFVTLNIPISNYKVLTAPDEVTQTSLFSGSDIAELKELYDFRNRLVHEIDIATLGHPNVRDSWAPEAAMQVGKLVEKLIRGLEAILTKHAPRGFPNLLSLEGEQISRDEILSAEIEELELSVESLLNESISETGGDDREDWLAAKTAAANYLTAEQSFVDGTLMLHYRYEDLRSPIKTALLQSRRNYLRAFLGIYGEVWETN
jgi:hypothetical protein